jgi:hypothetical protein
MSWRRDVELHGHPLAPRPPRLTLGLGSPRMAPRGERRRGAEASAPPAQPLAADRGDPPMLLSLLLSARHQKLVEQLSSNTSTGAPPDR